MIEQITAFAPAKINLSLHVLGRQSDGYHVLDSMVAFSDFGDILHVQPGRNLFLAIDGPTANATGTIADNLVMRAIREVQMRREGIMTGVFTLIKNLPVAAGIGGGSSDAAAALRLLAKINELKVDDPILIEAAKATGADVPVCLDPRLSRMMGIGEIVERIGGGFFAFAVLVNPRVSVATPDVFRALGPSIGERDVPCEPRSVPASAAELHAYLQTARNDLEAPALSVAPIIGNVLTALRNLPDCKLARMSGSGATVFGLFDTHSEAEHASHVLNRQHPEWWIQAVTLS